MGEKLERHLSGQVERIMREKTIDQAIGVPALLEQCAEEACELGQAALKMARGWRNENPVYKTREELDSNLAEEVADILVCIDALYSAGLVSRSRVYLTKAEKEERWEKRLKASEKM